MSLQSCFPLSIKHWIWETKPQLSTFSPRSVNVFWGGVKFERPCIIDKNYLDLVEFNQPIWLSIDLYCMCGEILFYCSIYEKDRKKEWKLREHTFFSTSSSPGNIQIPGRFYGTEEGWLPYIPCNSLILPFDTRSSLSSLRTQLLGWSLDSVLTTGDLTTFYLEREEYIEEFPCTAKFSCAGKLPGWYLFLEVSEFLSVQSPFHVRLDDPDVEAALMFPRAISYYSQFLIEGSAVELISAPRSYLSLTFEGVEVDRIYLYLCECPTGSCWDFVECNTPAGIPFSFSAVVTRNTSIIDAAPGMPPFPPFFYPTLEESRVSRSFTSNLPVEYEVVVVPSPGSKPNFIYDMGPGWSNEQRRTNDLGFTAYDVLTYRLEVYALYENTVLNANEFSFICPGTTVVPLSSRVKIADFFLFNVGWYLQLRGFSDQSYTSRNDYYLFSSLSTGNVIVNGDPLQFGPSSGPPGDNSCNREKQAALQKYLKGLQLARLYDSLKKRDINGLRVPYLGLLNKLSRVVLPPPPTAESIYLARQSTIDLLAIANQTC